MVKNSPAKQEMQKTWVPFLGQEDPLEWEVATHSDIIPWEVPWTEAPGGLQSMGVQRVGHNRTHVHVRTHTHTHIYMHCKMIILLDRVY